MSEKTLRIAVAVVLAAGLIVVGFVFRDREQLPTTPEATVSEFFDAAGRGDDAAYLRLLDGKLRRSLSAQRSQEGKEAFREGIRRTATGIKGLATMPNSDAPDGMVALDVDIVFADRNENQRILLAPKGNGWAIVSIDAAQMSKPPIPYGTPVFEGSDGSVD
jgi:hypothetical protein